MSDWIEFNEPLDLYISLDEWRQMIKDNFVYETEDMHVDLKTDKNVTVYVSYPEGIRKIDMSEIN